MAIRVNDCYRRDMTKQQIEAVLKKVRSWPEQDQRELAEAAREIEARRIGSYRTTDEERRAIEGAMRTPLVPEEDMHAFWEKHSIG